jgi:iron(III) transport system permease protein
MTGLELPYGGRRASWLVRLERLGPAVLLLALVVVVGYLTVLPLARLQYLALEDGAAGYREAFTTPGIWQVVRWTIQLGLGSLVIAVVLGTALAWAAYSLPPWLSLLRILPIFPIIVPAVAAVLGWAFLFSPVPGYLNQLLRTLPWWSDLTEGPVDVYSMPWIIIITGLALTSFVYIFVSAGLENINDELIEAAYVSGSSPIGVFFRVILPLLRPSLVYGTGVALLLGLGQFTAPLLLGRTENISVLTTEMYFATAQIEPAYGVAAALGSPLLVFGVFVLFVNRVLLGDPSRFVTHGTKGGFRPAARRGWLGAAVIILYSFVSIVLPLGALVIVSLSKFWTGEVDPSTWTLDSWREILDAQGVTDAIRNSVVYSIAAVLIVLPLGYVAATFLRRTGEHRVGRPVLDFVVAMPLSIPAAIFGVGFLLTYTNEPLVLYGSGWVLILVYVTLMIPFSTRMQLSGLAALGDTYVEAARVSGAGPVRAHLSILVPLLRPTFGGAAALIFVLLTHEFAASLLVRSPTTNVMGTILYDYYENGGYPTVAVISLIMVAVTTVGVLVAFALAGSDVFRKL